MSFSSSRHKYLNAFAFDYFDSFLALQTECLLVLSKQGFVP